MKSLNTVGLALSVVFGCLLLALVAEIYYLLWWKRRFRNRDIEDGYNSSPATREFFYMFCWKKPSSFSSTALNPQELTETSSTHVQESLSNGQSSKDFWFRPFGEDSVEAELLGLQNLSGPPRFLFTIMEETKEDLESEEGGGKSRKSSRTRSLSDLVLNADTPFLTPLTSPSYFTPPRTPMDAIYNHNGFNPLYESTSDAEFNKIKSSPPPTFKFLRDAEDKLQKKKLLEEAENCSHKKERFVTEDEDSSYITLIVPRHNKEKDTFYSSSSSQMENEHDYQEELEAQTETVASNPRKRKGMESRSDVWEHYEKIKDENRVIVKGKCKYCAKDLSANTSRNGTSSLRNHLKSCKSYNVEGRQMKLAFQTNKDGGNTTLGSWIFDKDLAREKYIKMIIVDELPFRFGEGLGFKEFMATVQPVFQIPSRWTVARDCYGMYSLKRNEFKKSLLESTQRLCLTMDTWTSNQRINYMCLTAHFIDKDWKLHKRILNFCPIVSHKGKAIAMAIEECLVEWGITRVLSITVDNASSNDVALTKLKERIGNWDTSVLNGEHLHLRCVAHILNLIVKDGLGLFDGSISKVRNAVKYVRQSPAREVVFMECAKYEKIETKRSLILDVDTRWNSTYEMLDVAEKYERAFSRYDTQDPRYKKHLKMGNVDGRPTCEDWVTVRKFASFLRIFYDLTLKISGTSYVTSNIFLHEIYAVHSTLNDWTYGANVEMHAIGKEMLEKFEKYWGSPVKMNNLLFIAVVLDPRHKLQFVVYMLKHMYGEDVGGLMGKSLEETLYKMFNQYKSKLAKNKQRDDVREKNREENVGQVHPSQLLRMQFEKDIGMISSDGSASDLEEYLSEKAKTFRTSERFDILEWWKNNSMRFPVLSQMARDILAFPISTVASESAFSTGGRVLNDFRSSLTPKMVEALICAQDWMRRTAKAISVEEDPDEMKQLDEALEKMNMDANSTAASATGGTGGTSETQS